MGLLGVSLFLLATFSASVVCVNPNHPSWSLLDLDKCGVSITDKIIGGKEPSLGHYPWLAVLGYELIIPTLSPMFSCGGALINKRYVLTAAHCITDLFFRRLDVVRLGEHDLRSDPDCEIDDCQDGVCEKYCADPVQEIKPQRLIYHENYNTPKFKHDVGLVRLEREAKITEWVTPICLPYGQMMDKYHFGRKAEVAGWGITENNSKTGSNTLMHVCLEIVNNQMCVNSFNKVYISYSQMCAGGAEMRDSCSGDSGGPLMLAADENGQPRYYVVGIVSFGPTNCGTKGTPGVYTRVTSYMPWILDNIRP